MLGINRSDLLIIRKEYTNRKRLASGKPNLVSIIVVDQQSLTSWVGYGVKKSYIASSIANYPEDNPLSVHELNLIKELRTNDTLLINVYYPLELVLTEYQQQKVWKQ